MITIFSLRPFLAIIGSMLVGFLVSHGVVDSTNATVVQQNLDTLAGALITVVSVVAALYHYVVKHPTKVEATTPSPTETSSVQDTPELSTPVVQQVSDTPPPAVAVDVVPVA